MTFDWWTLGLQTINVLVLLWILQRFLFKPAVAAIGRRQQELQHLTNDANLARQQAERERQAIEVEHSAIGAERDAALNNARLEAQQTAADLLEKTERELALRRESAQAQLSRERSEAERVLQQRACELAAGIVRRLLQRIPAERLDEVFFAAACAEIPAFRARHAALQDDGETAIHVATATPFDDAAQARARLLLGSALGDEAAVGFSSNPGLLAGVELRLNHAVISNNLAADLRDIMEQLQHEHDTIPVA